MHEYHTDKELELRSRSNLVLFVGRISQLSAAN